MSKKCHICGAELVDLLQCHSCDSLQNPAGIDPFDFFEMESRFDINTYALEKAYLIRQNQLHPDRFVNANEEQKTLAILLTSELNRYYDMLKSPYLRAGLLLEKQNIKIDGEKINDKEFLTTMLEKAEILDNCKDMGDISKISHWLGNLQQQTQAKISYAFEDGDFSAAKEEVLKFRFLVRMSDDIKQKKNKFLSAQPA